MFFAAIHHRKLKCSAMWPVKSDVIEWIKEGFLSFGFENVGIL